MARKIRIAWINDPVASMGRTPVEEIEHGLPALEERLGYQCEIVVQGRSMLDAMEHTGPIDLLLFDYGGAGYGTDDLMWHEMRAMCEWAHGHEGTLVLLFSMIGGRMYANQIQSESYAYLKSENIMTWYAPGLHDPRKDLG